jgi:hypothetical protein
MKLASISGLAALFFTGIHSASTHLVDLVEKDAVTTTILSFYRSLDEKSEALMRSVTTTDLVFDGTLFAAIGLGAPAPLVGIDIIAPGLLAAFTNITTMHNVGTFHVESGTDEANKREPKE